MNGSSTPSRKSSTTPTTASTSCASRKPHANNPAACVNCKGPANALQSLFIPLQERYRTRVAYKKGQTFGTPYQTFWRDTLAHFAHKVCAFRAMGKIFGFWQFAYGANLQLVPGGFPVRRFAFLGIVKIFLQPTHFIFRLSLLRRFAKAVHEKPPQSDFFPKFFFALIGSVRNPAWRCLGRACCGRISGGEVLPCANRFARRFWTGRKLLRNFSPLEIAFRFFPKSEAGLAFDWAFGILSFAGIAEIAGLRRTAPHGGICETPRY